MCPTLHTFLLMVGNSVCLVLLCLISARRDKVCPLYRVRNWRNTNHLQPLQKLYGPLGNSCTISPYFFWAKMTRFWPSNFVHHWFQVCCIEPIFAKSKDACTFPICHVDKAHQQSYWSPLWSLSNDTWTPTCGLFRFHPRHTSSAAMLFQIEHILEPAVCIGPISSHKAQKTLATSPTLK